MKPEFTPVILDYSDDGLDLEDLDGFIESIKAFKIKVKEQYGDQKVKIYLLPSEMISMMLGDPAAK